MRISDWSSDVCSSDLTERTGVQSGVATGREGRGAGDKTPFAAERFERPARRQRGVPRHLQLQGHAADEAQQQIGEVIGFRLEYFTIGEAPFGQQLAVDRDQLLARAE